MAKGKTQLENEAAQSTTALGPLVGLAREDFVGAVALLLRETATDPSRSLRHMQAFGDDVVKIMTGKSELSPDPKDKRFMDPAWRYNPFFRAGAQYYLAIQKGMKNWLEELELDELERDRSQYQAMREQRLEQLEAQRQEQNRDRPQPRQQVPDWTR